MIEDMLKFDWVLSNFEDLEGQMRSCLEFIPRVKNNSDAVSPKFIPIIIESCSLIESIFKNSLDGKKPTSLKAISKEIESNYELEDNLSLFLDSKIEVLNPFQDWTKKQPCWWEAYNSFKHNRLENLHQATMENAIAALCGLHQVISKNLDFVPSLITKGWIVQNNEAIELLSARIASSGISGLHVTESRYFASSLDENFISYENGVRQIDENFEFSEKLKFVLTVDEWF